MSSRGDPDPVAGTGRADYLAAVRVPRSHDRHDPWLRIGPGDVVTLPLASQPDHGSTAFVRRQPARTADGRFGGGCADVSGLICPGCGDHPYLDYSEVPGRSRWRLM